MKLTNSLLRKIVFMEAKKFGKPRSVSDVVADEVDADKLASTLEKKEDFSVKEIATFADKHLALTEQRLINQLRAVKARRSKIARIISNRRK